MSALMTSRRRRSQRPRRDASRQPALFGAGAAPVATGALAPTVPAAEPMPAAPAAAAAPAGVASAHREGPTLEDIVLGAWEGLLAGAQTDCPACGSVLHPRHSAGAGVVGGRCGGCGTTLA